MISIKFRIIKMDRKKQNERKNIFKVKYATLNHKKRMGVAQQKLKEFKKELTEINSIIDHSSTSSSNSSSIRSSGVTSSTSSSNDSKVNPRGCGVNVSSRGGLPYISSTLLNKWI